MEIKAERTGKHEFTAWTVYAGGFQVITKNAFSYREMINQISKFLKNSGDEKATILFNDYTDEEGNVKLPKEI